MSRARSTTRRCLGIAAGTVLAALVIAPTAQAETREVTSGHWAGSKITTPERVAVPDQTLTAVLKRSNTLVGIAGVTFELLRAPGIPGACTVATGVAQFGSTTSAGQLVSATTAVNCNGAYPFTVDAYDRPPLSSPRHLPQLSSTLVVEVPPPAVNGVTAKAAEGSRTVTISWTASASPAPDFLGYRIQRRLGSGTWATVDSVSPGATSTVDSNVPADPGEYSYRVLGRRAGAGESEVLSSEGNVDSVTLAAGDPTSSTSTTLGDGTTTPTNPDGTPGGGAPGSTTPSTTPDGKLIPRIIGGTGGRGRLPTSPAPRLGSSTQNGLGVMLTPIPGESDGQSDGGFDETLPFGDPGIDDSLADGDEGSSLFYEGTGGRGMAVPVAVGFVFFAWAIHLRFLARASKPQPGQVSYGDSYTDTWDPFDPFYDPML